MKRIFLNCDKPLLPSKEHCENKSNTILIYPKIMLRKQLNYRPFTMIFTAFVFSMIFVMSLAACSGGGNKEKKSEIQQADEMLGDMPDMSVAEKRAKREAQFQEEAKDPSRSPIQDPNAMEKAPAEFGFGKKTEKQIESERPRTNRIGILVPLEGDLQVFGKDTMDGAEMASDELNEHGGIKKQQFDIIVYDTKSSMDGARAGAKQFLQEQVSGIVGAPTGEVSFSATKFINDNQLALVSAGSRRRLGDTGPYNFRVTLNDSYAIKRLMDYAVTERKYKKFAIFTSLVNDFSIQLSAAFKQEIEKNKGTLTDELYLYNVEMANIPKEEESIPAQLKKLKKNVPDALIYTGDGKEGATIVKEMRKMGLKIPIIGGEDIMFPEYLAVGDLAGGTLAYGGFNVDSEHPRVKAFVEKFKKKYQRAPSRVAALSYDAYYILAKGLENAKDLRPYNIRMGLMGVKDHAGVTGMTSIGENREAIKEPFLFEMKKKGDKYAFVSIKEPL